MECEHCGSVADDRHHVIYKSQGGTNNEYNLIYFCRTCHHSIHHGNNDKLRKEVLRTCYQYIKPNIDKCWSGKICPKIVNLIKAGEL